mmetsp:Transcript_61346/g.150160  ORF Transcript_61346/g.150160 Transcript_61346/m.150160 type:complete len:453 (+) Transcript_61346:304-1662(+)|eukprot:CAMPEP_0113452406 /NCGR_PEP_ID=MMETSP0014_2-20120614/6830_1 /TAXON_ID=2857 /ORGANISM="Nitzschia sp." /LENGTH=452 /DNA_ID=CAMNT_0000343777 /DNA_START=203 /DNA_END=1561 /DNA_ORIENTATION=- /assembly_acc=CAM_ASM_000159
MGSSISYAATNHNGDEDQQQPQRQQQRRTLSELLREDPVQWNEVRQSLRDCPEQACLYAHGLEDSQLFVAVSKRGCPLDIAQTILQEDEDALEYRNAETGQTVLHAAIVTRATASLPVAAEQQQQQQQQNNGGGVAVDDSASVVHNANEIVRLLLSQPSGRMLAQTPNKDGIFPIHLCRSKDTVELLADADHPCVCRRSHRSGSLPLHHMIESNGPIDPDLCHYVVQKTLDLGRSNSNSNSSCMSIPPLGGILTRNRHGKTPLSLLVDHIDDDMIKITNRKKMWSVLRETFLPIMMSTATITRGRALHTLIDYRCLHSERMMDMALKLYSHQTSFRDELGRTPLHVAVADTGSCRCSYAALQSLIDANPKAPRMADKDGRLPIDWAAECPHVSTRNLALLMKGEPRAIDTRDLQTHRYPFVAAALKEHHNSINNTYVLLRSKPHVLSYFHTP